MMFPCASVTVTFFVMGVFPSHRRFVIASKDAVSYFRREVVPAKECGAVFSYGCRPRAASVSGCFAYRKIIARKRKKNNEKMRMVGKMW